MLPVFSINPLLHWGFKPLQCWYSNNKPPIFDGLYIPFLVIRGMVYYYCYTNIMREGRD